MSSPRAVPLQWHIVTASPDKLFVCVHVVGGVKKCVSWCPRHRQLRNIPVMSHCTSDMDCVAYVVLVHSQHAVLLVCEDGQGDRDVVMCTHVLMCHRHVPG